MYGSRALRAVISGLPSGVLPADLDTWTRTIKKDPSALIIGLNTAWRRAQDREQWQRTVEAAMLQHTASVNDFNVRHQPRNNNNNNNNNNTACP